MCCSVKLRAFRRQARRSEDLLDALASPCPPPELSPASCVWGKTYLKCFVKDMIFLFFFFSCQELDENVASLHTCRACVKLLPCTFVLSSVVWRSLAFRAEWVFSSNVCKRAGSALWRPLVGGISSSMASATANLFIMVSKLT